MEPELFYLCNNPNKAYTLSELYASEPYTVVDYFINSNFVELEKNKEEVIWETEDDIFSLCQNPTAIKIIRMYAEALTETDTMLAAYVTGISLNPNPEIIDMLIKYLGFMSQENWDNALKNPEAEKLIKKAKSYKEYTNFKI